MKDVVAAAGTPAFASVMGSVLTFFLGIRQVRRSVSMSSGQQLGRVLESRLDRIERRLDRVDRSIIEVREWHAFRAGREGPPPWTPCGVP